MKTYAVLTAACAVYALGFSWFYAPNDIVFGGITGVAQIVNRVLPQVPIGTAVIVLNIPLFLLGWKFLGGRVLISSLYAMAVSSVFIDLTALFCQFRPVEPLLAAILGGAVVGLAVGLIFLENATTGGTGLIARLLKLKLAWLPMGKLVAATELGIILAAALVFGRMEAGFYGLVALYVSSEAMDKVLYGLDTSKVAYIISTNSRAIVEAIDREIGRGATVLPGTGGFSGSEKDVVLCAFKQRQIVALKRLVEQLDPGAFMIVCDAHDVLGEGFHGYHSDSP